MNLTEKQIIAIQEEANKQINKKYRMLPHAIEKFQVVYILEAYQKVVKKK